MGLGIAQFLKHSNDSGGGGQWLRTWRKNSKGEATIWLHTRAPIVSSFTHQFMLEDEYEDKETGKKVPTLRWPRFVSPDPEVVHRNQYFREDNGVLRVPPDLDPFLLVREWLRFADHLSLEQPIFQWYNAKERQTIVWERGPITGLVKRNQRNYGHSLDTKIEYVYVVVDNDNIDQGPVLMREGKLLSQKLAEVIKQQQKQWGDDQGDPTQHPYAFQLIAEEASSPMNAFKAFKAERAEFTDEVWEKIASDEFPDPTVFGQPSDGDMQKIRDAFEAAAQVELPLDEIFSEDSAVRKAVARGGKAKQPVVAPARQSKAAQARTQAKPPLPKPGATSAPKSEPEQQSAGPQTRRKKAAPAAPPPVETIPCEDCGTPMLPSMTKCEKCGAEYETDDEAEPTPPPKTTAKPATAPKPGAGPKPTTSTKPKPATTTKAKEPDSPADAPEGEVEEGKCWACGAELDEDNPAVCPKCSIEQDDEIPF